jgi:hypothetical protein
VVQAANTTCSGYSTGLAGVRANCIEFFYGLVFRKRHAEPYKTLDSKRLES